MNPLLFVLVAIFKTQEYYAAPMRRILPLLLLLAMPGIGEELPELGKLRSDKFEERQKAEDQIVEWAKEDESGTRAELLFSKFMESSDPEEFHRLTKILVDVHLPHKMGSIQDGPGFIGINMSLQANLLLRPQFEEKRFPPQIADPSRGVYITAVIPNTPAERAGLKAEDVVVAIDGVSIAGENPPTRLKDIISKERPGAKILLSVERGDENLEIEVTLMNGKAVPVNPARGVEPRIDPEVVTRLLKEDYFRWLRNQRQERATR